MGDGAFLDDRGRALETEYFRRRDAELLARRQADAQRQQAESARAQALDALAAALGVASARTNPSLERALQQLADAGITADDVDIVEWIPALEVAWEGGLDAAERDRLMSLTRIGTAPAGALDRLSAWCEAKPDDELFTAARTALRFALHARDDEGRALQLGRVLAGCDAVARAAGGWTGFRRVSAAERRVIDVVRDELTRPIHQPFDGDAV